MPSYNPDIGLLMIYDFTQTGEGGADVNMSANLGGCMILCLWRLKSVMCF